MVMARLESPLGLEICLVEPNPKAYPPEGIYIARTLVQVRWSFRDGLKCYSTWPKACERALSGTLRASHASDSPGLDYRQALESSSKLREVIEAAKWNLNNWEFQELEQLITKYEDISATDSADYGRTHRAYHHVDKADTRPVLQPTRRLSLPKQSDVNRILGD
jgi:hypothetical protein